MCKVLTKWGAPKGPSKVREGAPSEERAWERESGLWSVGGEESRGLGHLGLGGGGGGGLLWGRWEFQHLPKGQRPCGGGERFVTTNGGTQ